MLKLEDYIYAAVISHISWQQIATGPTYRIPEFEERLENATGVRFDQRLLTEVVQRLRRDGFAQYIENDIIGAYLKINYKPVYEYVAGRVEDLETPEAQYRLIGKRLLSDLLNQPEREAATPSTDEPPPILSQENAGRLVGEVDAVIQKLDELPIENSEKAQARSLLLAARSLAEAPEPPVSIIWELISRANAISGIAGLLVSIIGLFV